MLHACGNLNSLIKNFFSLITFNHKVKNQSETSVLVLNESRSGQFKKKQLCLRQHQNSVISLIKTC